MWSMTAPLALVKSRIEPWRSAKYQATWPPSYHRPQGVLAGRIRLNLGARARCVVRDGHHDMHRPFDGLDLANGVVGDGRDDVQGIVDGLQPAQGAGGRGGE